jgi:putative nucleotidyltransferase with HDIG domain
LNPEIARLANGQAVVADELRVTQKERALLAGQLTLLAVAGVAAVLLSKAEDWQPFGLFAVLLMSAALSECFRLRIREFSIATSFLTLVLAMILLGPTPAAVIGVAAMIVNALRRRPVWRHVVANISTYASFPIVGGAVFEAFGGPQLEGSEGSAYVLIVLGTFMATNILNFLLIAIDIAVMDKQPIMRSVRTVYLPTLPTEFAIGLLTAAVTFVYQRHDVWALALLGVVAFVFQYLLGTALSSLRRKEELEARTRQLASLQVGLLSTVLQTLSMRDKMTARHSAAVARYAREVARELGLSVRDQEVIHTAALLHDIGKFIFPDDILLANTRLTDEQFEIVRRHPEQGALLVQRIEGYGPVAEIILAHHERIDGCGYPHRIRAEDIPLGSRIISVADTYDVMTSRDSYRETVSSTEAIEELRRVAGSQLDPNLVETFIGLLGDGSLNFRHADDADFERELNFERRVSDYAAPHPVAA